VTGGDLGRRVAERRAALGLTAEDVATRAGMSPAYVRAVEGSPSPNLSRATLWRLAGALETTVDAISGSGLGGPPGRADPSGQAILERLSIEECRAMVAPGGVGRFVFSNERGPVAVPVNFAVLDGDIVFRTDSPAIGSAITSGTDVSFEVDHLDDALTEGWSVLLTGDARVITDPAELDQARSLDLTPWAGGERRTYVRVTPRESTGRRIRRRIDAGGR
jgi:transcriptional regulator with XRE-family HTH domain